MDGIHLGVPFVLVRVYFRAIRAWRLNILSSSHCVRSHMYRHTLDQWGGGEWVAGGWIVESEGDDKRCTPYLIYVEKMIKILVQDVKSAKLCGDLPCPNPHCLSMT